MTNGSRRGGRGCPKRFQSLLDGPRSVPRSGFRARVVTLWWNEVWRRWDDCLVSAFRIWRGVLRLRTFMIGRAILFHEELTATAKSGQMERRRNWDALWKIRCFLQARQAMFRETMARFTEQSPADAGPRRKLRRKWRQRQVCGMR